MSVDTRALDAMLSQLRSTEALTQAKPVSSTPDAGGADFAQVLKGALDQVSQAQESAQKMTEDFASGQSNVNLQDVMINLQKANVSFQEMVQVRNKLVTAYNDIMNMQV